MPLFPLAPAPSFQLTPIVRGRRLPTYSTSDEDSFLFDHDLNSYAFFDHGGVPVPQPVVDSVAQVGLRGTCPLCVQATHRLTSWPSAQV